MIAAALMLALVQDHYSEGTIGPRYTIVGGTAIEDQRWSDLVKNGIGFEIQYSYLWKIANHGYAGLYGGFSYDSFDGKTTTIQDPLVGNLQIKPDSMGFIGIEVGGKVRQNFGHFFADCKLGVGAAIYQKVDADFSAGGITVSDEVIASSAAFLFTVGTRFGWMISDKADLAFGVAYQANGAPKEGSGIDGHFKSMSNVVLALTLDVNF